MKNYLCLDIGTVRVGVAIKIGEQAIGQLTTLKRAQNQALSKLLELIAEHQIDLVVAGLPLDENNQETTQALDVRRFLSRFAKRMELPIMLVDEYGSSLEAMNNLPSNGSTEKLRKKGHVDSLAASEILTAYLDNRGVIGPFES